MSAVGFSGISDLVVWPVSFLDIALWVKSKMAAISQGQTKFELSKKG